MRYVGFTGHKNPAIHLKMLAHDFPFDSVQMPLNCFDATLPQFRNACAAGSPQARHGGAGHEEHGRRRSADLKGAVTAEEALRYAMSLPVAVTISGIDSLAVMKQNLAVARGFTPLKPEEMEALAQRCAKAAGDGHLELYKSTTKYDGAIGREQHGYPTVQEMPL